MNITQHGTVRSTLLLCLSGSCGNRTHHEDVLFIYALMLRYECVLCCAANAVRYTSLNHRQFVPNFLFSPIDLWWTGKKNWDEHGSRLVNKKTTTSWASVWYSSHYSNGGGHTLLIEMCVRNVSKCAPATVFWIFTFCFVLRFQILFNRWGGKQRKKNDRRASSWMNRKQAQTTWKLLERIGVRAVSHMVS